MSMQTTIPRVMGGTLFINIPQPTAKVAVIATGRDGQQVAVGRDGQNIPVAGRDGSGIIVKGRGNL